MKRRFSGVLAGLLSIGIGPSAFGTTIIYALTKGGGDVGQIYRSTDSAKTWQPTAMGGVGFAVDPNNANIVYSLVRTTTKKTMNSGGPAVLRSTDGGQTFTATDFNGAAPIVVDSTMSNILYAAGPSSGVFRSTDSGNTWTQTSLASTVVSIRTSASAPGVVFALMKSTSSTPITMEIDKSTDFGATWTVVTENPGFSTCSNVCGTAYDLNFAGNNPSSVYLAAAGECGTKLTPCDLPISSDGGKSWQPANVPGTFGNIEIDPRSGNIFAGGYTSTGAGEIIKSGDGGKTWTTYTNGLSTQAALVHIDPESESILYATQWRAETNFQTYGGVCVSTDSGQTWTLSPVVSQIPVGNEPYEYQVDALQAVSDSHPPLFAGEVPLSAGVYYLTFPDRNLFGYYTYVSSSILYHYDMGYEAFIPGSGADVYLYDFTSSHWWYTSSALFPYLYDFTLNSWLYYFPNAQNPGHYTNPRSFSNLTTGKIFTM